MLMTSFLTPKTLSTGKVELSICCIQAQRGEIFLCTEAAAAGQRRTVCGCMFAVCVFVCMKLKCFVRQKQCFTTPMPDGRLWRRRRLLPGVPLSTHAHTDTHNHHCEKEAEGEEAALTHSSLTEQIVFVSVSPHVGILVLFAEAARS